jgi:trimeric autotransporter adhesin
MRPSSARSSAVAAGVAALAIAAVVPIGAQLGGASRCRVSGRAESGSTPLPGVSIVVRSADTVSATTSTNVDGSYALTLPAGSYTIVATLTGFNDVRHPITLADGGSCDTTLPLALTIAPRASASTSRNEPATSSAPGAPSTPGTPPGRSSAQGAAVPNGAGRGTAGNGARSAFQSVDVQTLATSTDTSSTENADRATRLLLPPGFSTDAPGDAIAINGNAASLDRGLMNDRFGAIGRGEIDPLTGEAIVNGFGPGDGSGAGQGNGGLQRGGPGGFGGGPGGRGGPSGFGGGRGGFLGGRGVQQNRIFATTNYSFGGSALDSKPYQLHSDTPAPDTPYTRQSFGGTIGGPLRIPHLYDGSRRTSFVATYNGSRGMTLFDQYATVPTGAMRAGNFSGTPAVLIDPVTGWPFANNQIPASRIDPASASLLSYLPLPNLPGASRNFHNASATDTSADSVSVRVTHNFTPSAGGGFGRGGFGGFGGGRGGPNQAQQGTSVTMTAQFQYRRGENELVNVLPALGGLSDTSSLAVPITLNLRHKRSMYTVNLNASRTSARTSNNFAGVTNVAGIAGISGVSTEPFDWGVPSLAFSSLSSVNDVTPLDRSDRRIALNYSWIHPLKQHLLRAGGDVRFDRSSSVTDPNAAGSFVFTGLYTSGGEPAARVGGYDFADFLLGLPQQASVQYGPGTVTLRGRETSLFVQDEWRPRANLTLNLGLRYELIWPFVETDGRLVTLDVAPGFTAAVPVEAGQRGPYHGSFPDALINTDTNNLAPRLGAAWRIRPGMILRGGYGVSFNSGSYPTIARQLARQPPYATAATAIGEATAPLLLQTPFVDVAPDSTANTYGIDPLYDLGRVQTWNADLSRDIGPTWNVGAGYTRTTGSSLDIVRAPNRGPDGLRIEGVQPFLWQTSEGASVLNAGTFRLQRRFVHGIGGDITYILAKSRDDASTIGGGGTVVAQNDQDLAAEWGLSSFDRRNQLTADFSAELPFGPNKRWLHDDGVWADLFRDWRASATLAWMSGTPLTPRVSGDASDVARGTNGTLRADYNGQPIQLAHPTIDEFFDTVAFSVPAAGTFGTAGRNIINGPGSHQVNGQVSRDIHLHGTRTLTLQLTGTNLLNAVNYAVVDAIVNAPTFGQVLSVRPMRSLLFSFRFRY